MKRLFFIIFILFSGTIYAEILADEVLQLHSGTQNEINNVVNPNVGSVVYNTDDKKIYTYNGTQWGIVEGEKQNIQNLGLSGTTLTVGIEDGAEQTVDLVSLADDADADASNEIQDISTDGAAGNITLSSGSTLTLNVDDADADSNNELQTLSISGQDITLSNGGGTVAVPTETPTKLSQDTTTGVIIYANEDASDQTANVVSSDDDNQIVVGTDGGAFVGPTVHAGYFVINSNGAKTITGLPFEPSQIIFSAQANVGAINVDARSASNNTVDVFVGSMNGFVRKTNSGNEQQVIFVGQSGYETGNPYVNHISRYASNANCVGIRYGDQNGNEIGKQIASLTSFNSDGFTINVTRSGNASNKNLVVLFTAYK